MGVIYLRTNLLNGKQYVGQTQNMQQRENKWRCMKHHYAGKLIDNARSKYGFENWSLKIIVECDDQKGLDELEAYYINYYGTKAPNGYNLTDGGGSGNLGYKHSEEAKKTISAKNKISMSGKHHTEETKKKLSEIKKGTIPWIKGKHHSNETKKKISDKKKGVKHTKEWFEKVRNHPSTSKEIAGFNENNEEVCRFKSVEEAIRHGYSRHIGEVANGKRIKSNNLFWKWIK